MKASEYQAWMRAGFINVEAELAHEIIRPKPYVSEERVRSALLDGLAISRGQDADRLEVEEPTPYTAAPCWKDATHGSAKGRPLQHDLWVTPSDDCGLACEVKWLKGPDGSELMKDLFKLVLARGCTAEGTATRCYMLVGGQEHSITKSFATIRTQTGESIRWSPQGASGNFPSPSTVDLRRVITAAWGRTCLEGLLGFGKHVRTPPSAWACVRVSVRAAWMRTVGGRKWRLVLLEVDHRGLQADQLDWVALKPQITLAC